MTIFSRAPRRALTFSLAAALAAGLWMPAHAQSAPDPNPPLGYSTNNRARGNALAGTITRVYSARSLDLRADDGRVYRVNLPVAIGLQAGTTVRVRGELRGSTFTARTVTIGDLNDRDDNGYNNGNNNGNGGYNNSGDGYDNGNGGYNNGGYDNGNGGYNNGNGGYPDNNYNGQQVVLRGRVTRIFSRVDFEVRDDDDGRVYRVKTDESLAREIGVGDSVETRGALNGTTIRAQFATAQGTFGNPNDVAVDFPARIETIDLYNEEASVRGDNGRIYRIHLRRARLDDFRVGQRVRVKGVNAAGRVEVSDLTRVY